MYCCDSACCGSSLKARCHIQRVICVYKHTNTHREHFQQPPNQHSNPAVFFLCPHASSQSKRTKFPEFGQDHLLYSDEEKNPTHYWLQRAEFNFPTGTSHLQVLGDRKTPTASKIIQFPFSLPLRKTAYPHAMQPFSLASTPPHPLYPRQDPYQSCSPPGFIRRHLFLHIPGGGGGR